MFRKLDSRAAGHYARGRPRRRDLAAGLFAFLLVSVALTAAGATASTSHGVAVSHGTSNASVRRTAMLKLPSRIALQWKNSAYRALAQDAPAIDTILRKGIAAGSNGVYGYYLKQVNGPVLLARNDGLTYDPASAIKTLYLTYAMQEVANGGDALTSPVTAYLYPHSRNANGNPASPDLCPDPADEVPADIVNPAPTLQEVLAGMMQVSNNRYARAIELRYGRSNLQTLATSLGMSNTHLNQILGCGADGGVETVWTLDDAGRLYQAIADGTLVPQATLSTLYNLMLSVPGGAYSTVIGQEANSVGISVPSSFTAAVTMHHKGGSYDICYGSCAADDVVDRDEVGVLTLPFHTANGIVPTTFVWGVFTANEKASCSSFPCPAADQASAAVEQALPELFRPAIRAALESWATVGKVRKARMTIVKRGKGGVKHVPHCGVKKHRCVKTVKPGHTVKLVARPARGWHFVRWGGACRKAKHHPVCKLKVLKTTRVLAVFKK